MTKRQAIVVCGAACCLATWGAVFLLNALGAGERLQLAAAMLGLTGGPVAGALTFVHYARKSGDRR
jgi:hypothetical protein